MRQCEYEEVYDPTMGRHVEKHIHGKGMVTDALKAVGRRIFGKTAKVSSKRQQQQRQLKRQKKLVNIWVTKRGIK